VTEIKTGSHFFKNTVTTKDKSHPTTCQDWHRQHPGA